MTPPRLDEGSERAIRDALAAGPTPGPWLLTSESETVHGWSDEGEALIVVYELGTNEADHNLIAACNPKAVQSLLAELDYLRAALSTGRIGGEWLPIESAPKDGKTMYVVKAFNVEHGFPNGRPYTSDPYCVWPEHGDWVRWPHGFAPTHWMPLPAPPAPAAKPQGDSNAQ